MIKKNSLTEPNLKETSGGPSGDSSQLSPNPENLQEMGSDTEYDLPSPPHTSVFSKKKKNDHLQAAHQQVDEWEEELVKLQAEGKKSGLMVKDWSPIIRKKITLLRGKISRKKKSIGRDLKTNLVFTNVNTKSHPAASKTNEKKKSTIPKESFDLDQAIEFLEAKEKLFPSERTQLKKLKAQRRKHQSRKHEYQNESESQRLERHLRDKNRSEEVRKSETNAQRSERRLRDKQQKEEVRKSETEDEKNKRNRKDSDKKRYKRRAGTKITRLGAFRKQVRYGPVYPCITCHQLMFRHQVLEFTEDVQLFLGEKCSDERADNTISCPPDSFFMTIHEEKIGSEDECDQITMISGGSEEERRCFLCKVCYSHLKKDVLPPKAAANYLKAMDVPEDVQLSSYLEEALLARTLLFMKIFSLKSSLMPAIKDKCVVIPIDCVDVLNTVQSLPRLPSESGIIDIQWKRRLGQKNAHLQAKVEPARIFRALEFLRASGNKHYADTSSREEYEERCLQEDPDGYDLLFGSDETEEQGGRGSLRVMFLPDGAAETILELAPFCELQNEQVQGRL